MECVCCVVGLVRSLRVGQCCTACSMPRSQCVLVYYIDYTRACISVDFIRSYRQGVWFVLTVTLLSGSSNRLAIIYVKTDSMKKLWLVAVLSFVTATDAFMPTWYAKLLLLDPTAFSETRTHSQITKDAHMQVVVAELDRRKDAFPGSRGTYTGTNFFTAAVKQFTTGAKEIDEPCRPYRLVLQQNNRLSLFQYCGLLKAWNWSFAGQTVVSAQTWPDACNQMSMGGLYWVRKKT